MRLVCPSCRAAYDVPDHRLRTGTQRLRCTRCAHEWTMDRPAPPPPAEPAPAAPAAATRLRAAAPPLVATPRTAPIAGFPPLRDPAGFDRRALAAWAATVVLLAGLGLAAARYRAEIMQAWPPSQRLYALFGAHALAAAGPAAD